MFVSRVWLRLAASTVIAKREYTTYSRRKRSRYRTRELVRLKFVQPTLPPLNPRCRLVFKSEIEIEPTRLKTTGYRRRACVRRDDNHTFTTALL